MVIIDEFYMFCDNVNAWMEFDVKSYGGVVFVRVKINPWKPDQGSWAKLMRCWYDEAWQQADHSY